MIWTNSKIALTAGVIAVSAAVLTVVQLSQVSKLRQQNAQFSAEMRQAQQRHNAELARVRAEPPPIEQLRRDAAELLRLRGEVAALRKEKADWAKVKAQNEQALAQLRLAPPAAIDQDLETRKQEEMSMGIHRMNQAKQICLALHLFAGDHEDALPGDIKQTLAPYLGTVFESDSFELVKQGRWRDIKAPARTIVIKERAAVLTLDGKWAKAYGFADGHSEIHMETDLGRFEDWERARQ